MGYDDKEHLLTVNKRIGEIVDYRRAKTNGFSLTELMAVVVIAGMLALFAIPNYTKSVNRVRAKDAVVNLEMIREAVRRYMVHENDNPPPCLADIIAINTTLHLGVIEQEGNIYSCSATNVYTCNALNDAGWQVSFQLDTSDGDVFCSVATCPPF